MVAAPKSPGNRKYKAIEPAPGRYVKAEGLTTGPLTPIPTFDKETS